MLSIEECRMILKNPDLTDEEIEVVRDFLYEYFLLYIEKEIQTNEMQE